MTKQTALELKCKEVKAEILAMKEKIPSAIIFNALGRIFPKYSMGYWLSNIVLLNIIFISPWMLFGWLLGELDRTMLVFIPSIVCIELVIFGAVAAHLAIQIMLSDLANQIVVKVSDAEDLSRFLVWLKTSLSFRKLFAFVLPFCLLWVILGAGGMSIFLHGFVGIGLLLTVILVGLLAGIVFHAPIWTSTMVTSLKEYQYDVNPMFPADSKIINDISEMLRKGIYILASVFAVISFISSSSILPLQLRIGFSLPVVLFGWIVITAQFMFTRSTIEKIINDTKWEMLNAIQAEIQSVKMKGDLSGKESSEKILRLADIHKKIVESKTNSYNAETLSTLISQLMLPLIGFLLGHLDTLYGLFTKP